jgi:hypothetical protein
MFIYDMLFTSILRARAAGTPVTLDTVTVALSQPEAEACYAFSDREDKRQQGQL